MQITGNILKKKIFLLFLFHSSIVFGQNSFIENKGQMPENVITKTHLPSGVLFIEKAKCTYAFYNREQIQKRHNKQDFSESISAHAYTTSFINSNSDSKICLIDTSSYYENYFIGDSKHWATKVRSYKQHLQKNIYSGVNLLFFISEHKLKYELHVSAGKNPNEIKIMYDGLESISILEGDIICKTSVNTIVESSPYAYQIIGNKKVEVFCNYKLQGNIVSFVFPQGYNKKHKLIIDPILEFSTYSGSNADNFGYTATYDDLGFLYSGSTIFGVGYPTTLGAYDINYNNTSGGTDIAITKYDTTGTQRIYSTYLGGERDELPHSMIVNSEKELFLFGTTGSSDFPATANSYQSIFKGGPSFSPSGIGASFPTGSDIFISKLSKDGSSLLASTFIGGTGNDGLNTATELKYNYADEVRGEIDIDKNNNVFIATSTNSTDFPIKNGFQITSSGSQEGCILKLDNQLSSIIWSSYLGGTDNDAIYSLALDSENNIYVTGGTNSLDFPITPDAYLTTHQGGIKADAFVTMISHDGSQIMASSYFGSNQYDQSYFVEIGRKNDIYLFGQTQAPGTSLVFNTTYFQANGGHFISVFSQNLTSVLKSTVFGTGKGTPDISPTAFLVDVCEKVYIAGWGSNLGGPLSTLNLPVTPLTAFQSTTDGNDFYLAVFNDLLDTLEYATYFGGSQSNEHVDGGTSRFDKRGTIYQSVCAGCGGNSDFPIEPTGAVSSTNNSLNCNNGVFKFNFNYPLVIADFNAPFVTCNATIDIQNLSTHSLTTQYTWLFGDGGVSNLTNPTYTFTEEGFHNIKLIVTDPSSCNLSDTINKTIYILSNSQDTLETIVKCSNQDTQIGLPPLNALGVSYFWFPNYNLTSSILSNPFTNCSTSTEYQLIISNNFCSDTLIQQVNVPELDLNIEGDTIYCASPITLTATHTIDSALFIWSNTLQFIDTISNTNNYLASGPGVFYVNVVNDECIEIDSIQVFMENIDIDLIGNNICLGDTVIIRVENQALDQPNLSYEWSSFISDSSSIIDIPSFSRWYKVAVKDVAGCTAHDSIFISVYNTNNIDSLWADKETILKGERVQLNIQTNDSVYWPYFNSNSLTVEDFPDQNQCYQVQLFNEFNCTYKDSICISVVDVFCNEDSILIPTAFTPDQDENLVNEKYFIIDKSGVITEFKIEIFNRLGQKVFSSNNINKKWDGTYKGNKLAPQVLDYYLEIECVGGKYLFKKGNITLIR